MSLIGEIRAREILDSRGNPTVEADCNQPSYSRFTVHDLRFANFFPFAPSKCGVDQPVRCERYDR